MNTAPPFSPAGSIRKIRIVLGIFLTGLVLSGLTAIPLVEELNLICKARDLDGLIPRQTQNSFDFWILTVREGLRDTYNRHPWMAYGTDWLAFAHLIIALFFIGPWQDPVRNVWVLKAGIVACALVVPMALVFGQLREIPIGWRLVDCSFGVLGAIPLYYCLQQTQKIMHLEGDKK